AELPPRLDLGEGKYRGAGARKQAAPPLCARPPNRLPAALRALRGALGSPDQCQQRHAGRGPADRRSDRLLVETPPAALASATISPGARRARRKRSGGRGPR